MNQKASNTALVVAGIAIVLLVAIIFYEIFRSKPVEEESQLNNMVKDPNSGLENMLNEIYDEVNEVENEVVNEVVEEPEEKEPEQQQQKPTTSQTQSTTSKEDKALQMAKDKYGEEEGTYFSVDAVDSQGRYIVSVHELETTIMIKSYVVDLEKGTIVEQ